MGAAICQGTFSFTGNDRALPPHEKGRQRSITDIYNIYNIYPFLKMPVRPVFMRVSGKPQSGSFSNLGWQFLELWVAISRT